MPEPQGAVPVDWLAREPPAVPEAVLGLGAAAAALARRVLAGARANGASWLGLVGSLRGDAGTVPLLLLLDPTPPWAPGVHFFARDASAPSVLLPTRLRPAVSPALLQRLVSLQAWPAPVLALPAELAGAAGAAWIPAGGARPIDPPRLAGWLAEVRLDG